MPYHLEEADGGFYVVGPSGRKSNQPLSHERAVRQMRALYADEPAAKPQHAQEGGIVTMTARRKPMNQKQRRAAMATEPDADDMMRMSAASHMPGAANGAFFIAKAVGGNKGKFKAKAKAAGKTTAAYAKEKAHAPGTLGKEARLATTLMGMHK